MKLTVILALAVCLIEIAVLVTASPMLKPSILLGFLPEDVRLAAAEHPDPPKSRQLAGYLLLAAFFIAMVGAMLLIGIDGLKSGCGFWALTARFLVFFYINKVFDILVQDQWLVMTVGFYKKMFPETGDCAGWRDRGFNNRKQLVRLVSYPFLCMMTAGLFLLFG